MSLFKKNTNRPSFILKKRSKKKDEELAHKYINSTTKMDRKEFENTVFKDGKNLLVHTLDQHFSIVKTERDSRSLSNEQLLTTDLKSNKSVKRTVRKQAQTLSEQLQHNIAFVATIFQKYDFKSVDEALEKFDFSKKDWDRILSISGSQKQIHISYQSIRLSIQLFQKINKDLLSQVEDSRSEVNRQTESALLLKNAILVYELANAVVQFLKDFELKGLKELNEIHKEVIEELEVNATADEDLAKKCEIENDTLAESIRIQTLSSIALRKKLRVIVRNEWNNFISKLSRVEDNVGEVRNQISNLEMIRDNAKNQLGFLQIVQVTQMIKDNLAAIEGILNIEDIPLAPVTPEDLCRLLGISEGPQLEN